MKKYEQIEMKVILFNLSEDIITSSGPDSENSLPWVDMQVNSVFDELN